MELVYSVLDLTTYSFLPVRGFKLTLTGELGEIYVTKNCAIKEQLLSEENFDQLTEVSTNV